MSKLYCYNQDLFELAELIANSANARVINQQPSINSLVLIPDGLMFINENLAEFNLYRYYQNFIQKRIVANRPELLIQALKLHKNADGLDLTAGLGRDALILANFGYQIDLVENNPSIVMILNYLKLSFPTFTRNITINFSDHQVFLANLRKSYDFIYYDPMFNNTKSALAKKDMQLIAKLSELSNCEVAPQIIFKLMQMHCTRKIIIKRDNKQAPLINPVTYAKSGKTIRFDIYQVG